MEDKVSALMLVLEETTEFDMIASNYEAEDQRREMSDCPTGRECGCTRMCPPNIAYVLRHACTLYISPITCAVDVEGSSASLSIPRTKSVTFLDYIVRCDITGQRTDIPLKCVYQLSTRHYASRHVSEVLQQPTTRCTLP